MKIKLIPNKNLDIKQIPNPEDQSNSYQDLWEEFALTMNAYEVCGDLEAASELSSKVLKDPINASLTNLRCALFFYSVIIVGTFLIQILKIKE